ncbi:MAG: hypothetical protein HQM06_17155 [Magnetococcales bacterium]|nr:hypothetical protein [Magnetococcales bacterium]
MPLLRLMLTLQLIQTMPLSLRLLELPLMPVMMDMPTLPNLQEKENPRIAPRGHVIVGNAQCYAN